MPFRLNLYRVFTDGNVQRRPDVRRNQHLLVGSDHFNLPRGKLPEEPVPDRVIKDREVELMREEESDGPFDDKTMRLLKLAVAIGGMKEGAVHSSVRKARTAGATDEEIEQILALAASTLGLPPTVAVYSWVLDELQGRDRKR